MVSELCKHNGTFQKPHIWLHSWLITRLAFFSPLKKKCLTRLNRTAGGSRLKERATSRRWLPDSWVNRKDIFPCLTWPKPSTDLPLLSFSVRMAEHGYRTSMGRAKDFSKASCDVLVVTPPCPSTVSSLSRMPGLWAHRPLTQVRSHRSGASALTVPNEWKVDNQQRLSSTPVRKCQIREHANSSVYSAFYCNRWQDSSSIFN